uniref:UDP-glycosyltransferase n=1 Tax=uncultured Christiangramia sp. TaxID=503836 RepID=UPI00260457C7|nr:UDP-glycosyltransferase [uncultured Christiangramia sp.]
MTRKKIFILLPDGVGIRNFAFTSFVKLGEELGWEVIFWNATPFDLASIGIKDIKLNPRPKAYSDLIKRAKIETELEHFENKFNDPVYSFYRFPSKSKNFKSLIKNSVIYALRKKHTGEEGLKVLRKKLKASERKSDYYKDCLKVLKKYKPDVVFCTNQRPLTAVSPLTAAQDLNIPTATFIFSWDNLPKATMVTAPDFYFVWSNFMKKELQYYYPFISAEKIKVTGTPQFEMHNDESSYQSRSSFFKHCDLDPLKKYILYSGDDVTTCPDDSQYLEDVAKNVEKLNNNGYHLRIIFRRCPTDFSTRYVEILKKYENLITAIEPAWEKMGQNWNTVLPTAEDLPLLINTIKHCEMVINMGSSMVFDAALLNKPCLFINYDVSDKQSENWTHEKVYQFIHFRSMPQRSPVFWLNSRSDIGDKIKMVLNEYTETVNAALKWFETINKVPADKASERIWASLTEITE